MALPSVEAIVINFRDITERKQMESERAQLTERLNLAASSARIGIWDGTYRKTNWFGMTRCMPCMGLNLANLAGHTKHG